jgi:hypothetical protein
MMPAGNVTAAARRHAKTKVGGGLSLYREKSNLLRQRHRVARSQLERADPFIDGTT